MINSMKKIIQGNLMENEGWGLEKESRNLLYIFSQEKPL